MTVRQRDESTLLTIEVKAISMMETILKALQKLTTRLEVIEVKADTKEKVTTAPRVDINRETALC